MLTYPIHAVVRKCMRKVVFAQKKTAYTDSLGMLYELC